MGILFCYFLCPYWWSLLFWWNTQSMIHKSSAALKTYCGTAIITIYPWHPFIFSNCALNYVTMPSLPLPHSPDHPSFYSLNVYFGYLASEWNHTSFVLLYIYILLIFTLLTLYLYYSYINFLRKISSRFACIVAHAIISVSSRLTKPQYWSTCYVFIYQFITETLGSKWLLAWVLLSSLWWSTICRLLAGSSQSHQIYSPWTSGCNWDLLLSLSHQSL